VEEDEDEDADGADEFEVEEEDDDAEVAVDGLAVSFAFSRGASDRGTARFASTYFICGSGQQTV
jgi:hypothetical protein